MKKFFLFIFFSIFFICFFIINNFNNFLCLAKNEESKNIRMIPIIMYHSILKFKKSNYIISPSTFESDIKYLEKLGYEAIFISDIIAYCCGVCELPEKCVVLSFDDGHYNNYFYAYPIIKKHNFKANLNVIGSYSDLSINNKDTDNPNYSYVTWKEIKILHDSGYFEIGNHTYNMHSHKSRWGIEKLYNESYDEYKNNLTRDVMKLEQKLFENCGFRTQVFAYPFGRYSADSEQILKGLGFKAFLTCCEGINKVEKGNCTVLSSLKRINRTGLLSASEFFKKNKIC